MSAPVLPTIRSARFLTKRGNLDGVVIFSFASGSYSIVSYGNTKAKCAALGKLVDYVGAAIDGGSVPLGALDSAGTEGRGMSNAVADMIGITVGVILGIWLGAIIVSPIILIVWLLS